MTSPDPARTCVRRRARLPGRLRLLIERLEERALPSGQSPLLQFPSLVYDPTAYDSASILVRFNNGADLSLSNLPGATLETLPLVAGLHQVRLAAGMSVADALGILQGSAGVVYAQPNYRVSVSYLPSDVQFDQQWALNNLGQGGIADADIDAPEAWDVINTSPGVIVAVIDTGIDYNHPDLQGNIWTNPGETPGNGIDDDNNGYVDDVHGYDFFGRDGDPMDEHGHGTHVAGIIGAIGDNEIGVAGVTWDVQLMPIKFLDGSGSGWLSQAIEALNYAVANGATISNNSWNGGGFDQALADAIATAGAMDHLFITAAGNGGRNTDLYPSYPASYDLPNVLAVAATDQFDQLAGFSNYGHVSVDLAAPGTNIVSTVPGSGVVGNAGGYASLTGTSMAAPYVTGAAALLRSLYGGWSYQQVIEQILNTVDPLPSLEGTTVSGGRLNLAAAVNATPADDVRGPRIVSSTPANYVTGSASSVRLTFSESIDPASFTTSDILSFLGPAGPIIAQSITAVAGANNRQFDVAFAQQTALGNYTLILGPDIRDLAGNAMDQNSDGIKGAMPADLYVAHFSIVPNVVYPSSETALAINDFSITISSLAINDDLRIADVDVGLSINHPRDADLHIYLVSPAGTMVTLSAYHGEGANFAGTTFDDHGAAAIADALPPFAGRYRPDDPLAAFDGQNARGTWMLFIEDWGFGNEGELAGWSLIIKPDSGPGVVPPHAHAVGNFVPFAFNDFVSVLEDTATTIHVLANDFDTGGDALFITAVGGMQHGTAVINSDNTVTFTPDPDYYGPATFTYMVSDGLSSALAQVFLDVFPLNDTPIAAPDTAKGHQNTPIVFSGTPGNGPSLGANDGDVDGPALWIVDVADPDHGHAYINTAGDVVFVPDPGYSGQAGFEYTVSDGVSLSTAHVAIDVQPIVMISTTAPGALPGADGIPVPFDDSDIIQMHPGADGAPVWQMVFDGSDVGLSAGSEDVDAFVFLPNGSILISTTGAFSVPAPGGGKIRGSGADILQFWYIQLGANTVGHWSLYFDGSDVGLTAPSENIDALAVLPGGQLLISTTGAAGMRGAAVRGEDVLKFTPTALGRNTAGRWSTYFDGSDVGLGGRNENFSALHLQQQAGHTTIHFSTAGSFKLRGIAGNRDVVAFAPAKLGDKTRGAAHVGWSAADLGLGSLRMDGVRFGAPPALPLLGTSSTMARRLRSIAPPPPAAYLAALAALPPSSLLPSDAPPLTTAPPPADGPTDPPRLPDGTPISPILVREAVNRLFSAWGRPGAAANASLPDLAVDAAALPLFQFFTQVIRGAGQSG